MNTTYNPAIHHRRSIRLRNYDYGQAGYYYVTICIHEKRHLLGEIKGVPAARPYSNPEYPLDEFVGYGGNCRTGMEEIGSNS